MKTFEQHLNQMIEDARRTLPEPFSSVHVHATEDGLQLMLVFINDHGKEVGRIHARGVAA